jgi:hypothetical protein
LIRIAVVCLIPGVFLRELQPGVFYNFDGIPARLHIKAIIAIAVSRCLLDLIAILVEQVDADAAHPAFARILNAVLILILPDTVAEKEFRLH